MYFIDVYKADDKIAISGSTSLADIDLRRTCRAIDSVATGRIPSLFCGNTHLQKETSDYEQNKSPKTQLVLELPPER